MELASVSARVRLHNGLVIPDARPIGLYGGRMRSRGCFYGARIMTHDAQSIVRMHYASSDAMLCYVMLCYAMLCYVMLCYVMLCYVFLCYVMLCYAMLFYVMLCYVMLCYVILCYVTP